ncbi:hypothetical protein CCACVL1_13512 [Corchorus capsularis]|uniref:Uncharacterized protein n=1 Tax=Corchorus capsularis TaxID=210143 RepID=A0A1R3IAZ2_COCAP|nr:hypothetical protein CCACVL1_13512 [Corchorus capsularis]
MATDRERWKKQKRKGQWKKNDGNEEN